MTLCLICLAAAGLATHASAQQTDADSPATGSSTTLTPADDLKAGLDAYNAGDLPGSMTYFRKAADAGSAEAQAWLGYILDQSEDNAEAVEYYRAAAEQGNVEGIAGLAEMYAKGEGVDKDLAEAHRYFTKAGELGHDRSMRVLIKAYEKGGLGVEPDPAQAAYWKSRLAELDIDKQ
jgi:TPR repeat protein